MDWAIPFPFELLSRGAFRGFLVTGPALDCLMSAEDDVPTLRFAGVALIALWCSVLTPSGVEDIKVKCCWKGY